MCDDDLHCGKAAVLSNAGKAGGMPGPIQSGARTDRVIKPTFGAKLFSPSKREKRALSLEAHRFLFYSD